MGLLRESRQGETAARHAAQARGEGRSVFLYRFHVQKDGTTVSSAPVTGAADVIEAVEQQGWGLHQIAWDGDRGDCGAVLLLFRAR